MRRTWTIVAVQDVASSLSWYQALLGLEPRPPEHDYFGQVRDDDGTVLLCLHRWGDHDHPSLTSLGNDKPGNGLRGLQVQVQHPEFCCSKSVSRKREKNQRSNSGLENHGDQVQRGSRSSGVALGP
jgi:hypothetical protein